VETGEVERIVDVKGPVIYTVTSLAYDPFERQLYYTTDNGAHRDLVRVDPVTTRTELLMKDARIGDLAFNRADRSLWGIRHLNGICTLVRMRPPYREWTRVHSWPYGTVVYDLDVSPDGGLLSASFGEISGQQNVRVLRTADLLEGRVEPVARFDFGPSTPSSFVFSPDGRFLYGSSYFTGVSNVFRYELANGELEAVSNTETGFFRPIPIGDADGLFVFRYSGEGFVPARIDAAPLEDVSAITFFGEQLAEKHPVVKSWTLGSPARVRVDDESMNPRRYRLAGGLGRESWYPIVQGYKDAVAIGVRANFSDPLQLNRLHLAASYSPDSALESSERVHLLAEYRRYDWRARATLNSADFYDLFGPTKTGRRGHAVELGYHRTLVFDEPRRIDLDASATYAGDLDRLPEYQNVAVDVDRLLTLRGALEGMNVRSSLGHVDDEKGRRWSASLSARRAAGSWHSRAHGTFDAGAALPIGHSSVWLRTAAGVSPGSRDDVFSNFFFGGFGNNWVDHQNEKRYREYYSFPGVELNEIGGRNFARAVLEWNLPPIRFRRAGTPGFYLTWARPALFVAGLATDVDHEPSRRTAATLGGQLDLHLTTLSALDMMVSVGGAVAFPEGGDPSRELMVSLKVLR
jgi:hypothetical protein